MSKAVQPTEHPTYTHMTGEVYDLIYSEKDYQGEAAKVTEIITSLCESGGRRILDVACGTGNHMAHLTHSFDIDGFDLSKEQVKAATARFPENRIEQGDMVNFDMGEKYDAVICLFSSIGYLQTKEKLSLAVTNMAQHLKPGGVLLIETWLDAKKLHAENVSIDVRSQPITAYDYKSGEISINGGSSPRLHVIRVGTISADDGLVTTSKMHHMVARDGGSVEHFIETHKLAMYSDEDFSQAFAKAGLEFELDPEGLTNRRLCIGKKPL